jgi:hypothetical protein
MTDEIAENRLAVLDLSHCEMDIHGITYMLELI